MLVKSNYEVLERSHTDGDLNSGFTTGLVRFSEMQRVTQLGNACTHSSSALWSRHSNAPYCYCPSPHHLPSPTYTIHFKLSSAHNRPLFKVDRYQILHLKQYLIYSKAWEWIWEFLPLLLSMTPMPFIGWWRWIVVGWGAVWILTTCYKESTRTHLLPHQAVITVRKTPLIHRIHGDCCIRTFSLNFWGA